MKKLQHSSTSSPNPGIYPEKTRPKLQNSLTLSVTPSSLPPSSINKKAPNSTKARGEMNPILNISSNTLQRSKTIQNSSLLSQAPQFNPASIKSSIKENGLVKGYAAVTDQGLFRDYNEDRVSIILNINKPIDRQTEIWPKSSFFAVYDGHGGSACADFLRDNLHQFITRSLNFPYNPEQALIEGFALAEKTFADYARSLNPIETSGSCAIVVLVVGDMCYVANLGDSRAIMSGERGKKVFCLSKDHKPHGVEEKNRIEASGGEIYQSTMIIGNEKITGPYRVLPGRLSVSRSFGDIEAKNAEFGGNPLVLLSIPDIKAFKLHPEYDFIVLASDGIFDKLSNREVTNQVIQNIEKHHGNDIHRLCEIGVEAIILAALSKKTKDNITVVMIALDGLINKEKGFIAQFSQLNL